MKSRTMSRRRVLRDLGGLSLLAGLGLLPAACVYDPYYFGPPPFPAYYPDPFDYYFYPSVGVYFRFSTGMYYYQQDGVWVSVDVLPPHIHISAYDRVRIRIRSDKPWQRYKEHQRDYRRERPLPPRRDDRDGNREREANRRWYQNYRQHRDEERKRQRPSPRRDRDRDQDRDRPHR